ncbi:hypothetical protein B0J13DRAFT_464652, partial [Dactylonectria estremocensis]
LRSRSWQVVLDSSAQDASPFAAAKGVRLIAPLPLFFFFPSSASQASLPLHTTSVFPPSLHSFDCPFFFVPFFFFSRIPPLLCWPPGRYHPLEARSV